MKKQQAIFSFITSGHPATFISILVMTTITG